MSSLHYIVGAVMGGWHIFADILSTCQNITQPSIQWRLSITFRWYMPICPRSVFFLLIEHFATAATLRGTSWKKAFKFGKIGAPPRLKNSLLQRNNVYPWWYRVNQLSSMQATRRTQNAKFKREIGILLSLLPMNFNLLSLLHTTIIQSLGKEKRRV